ncbi:MAG: TRAP transporter small permease [Deltaproteobacteria bacterium]|nr:TRAP transporter small permease [Deltaproteobacteria bacterium]
MGIRGAVERLSDGVDRVMQGLLLVAGTAICIILFMQVVARYAGSSLGWSEEVGRHLLVAITFLGGSIAYKQARFIGLEGIGARLGPVIQGAITVFLQLLSLGLFALITWFGVKLTVQAWNQTSTALQIPMSIPTASIPVAGVAFVIHVVNDLLRVGGRR